MSRAWPAVLVVTAASAGTACGADVGDFPTVTENPSPGTGGRPPSGGSVADAGTRDARADAVPGSGTPHDGGGALPPSGANDASVEASVPLDSGASGVRRLLASLSERSEQCRVCAVANCPSLLQACGRLSGLASRGPGTGEPRSTLCTETVECITQSGCSVEGASSCYCGSKPRAQCLEVGEADGPCKDRFDRALETTKPAEVFLRITDDDFSGGWATSVVQCLLDSRCSTCFEVDASAATRAKDGST